MALAQAHLRLPGSTWDEEVVPALRKRLESESRTLSKRMSAISLSAEDAAVPPLGQDSFARQTTFKPTHVRRGSSTSTARAVPLQMENSHSGSTASTSRSIPNAAKPPAPTSSYQRSRTYSQPDSADALNGTRKSARNARPANGDKSNDSSRPRPPEPKPTRIPKPSRAYGGNSNGNTPVIPQTNGFSTYNGHHAPEPHEARGSHFTSSTTRSTVGLPNNRSTSGLMNEPPPFPPSSSVTSFHYPQNGYPEPEEAPPRPSIDSEERPFEHWYRGEVSRNGGVGELRVGRKQEMLEIANYGHMIRTNQRKANAGWVDPQVPRDDARRHRKRAGSIAGITEVERVRGSILFDEEGMDAVSRVLDEHPLTDLEGEESDIASLSSQRYRQEPDYIPGVGDISSSTAMPTMSSADSAEDRSTTPTPQPSRSGQYPPTRIPSRPARRPSESPPVNGAPTANGVPFVSKTPSPPLINGPTTNRSVSAQSAPSTSTSNGKRVVSPTTPGKKRAPVKSLRGKQAPPSLAKRDASKEERSVSQYPSPGDGEDMADAIPTWTQPVPKSGNWDEVVLPVVARQKGLEDYYQTADGSPQPKKVQKYVAPAPGTFGYDATKYRRRGENGESIPMDEFGRPQEQDEDQSEKRSTQQHQENTDEFRPYQPHYETQHDRTQLPVRAPAAPSPAPFSQYAPPDTRVVAPFEQQELPSRRPAPVVEDDKGAGCCKCTIM